MSWSSQLVRYSLVLVTPITHIYKHSHRMPPYLASCIYLTSPMNVSLSPTLSLSLCLPRLVLHIFPLEPSLTLFRSRESTRNHNCLMLIHTLRASLLKERVNSDGAQHTCVETTRKKELNAFATSRCHQIRTDGKVSRVLQGLRRDQ